MHRILQKYLSWALSLGLMLGSFRGYVALFEAGKEEPRQIFPYKISTLPPADQSALEKGIPVHSEKELAHLLEDFLS